MRDEGRDIRVYRNTEYFSLPLMASLFNYYHTFSIAVIQTLLGVTRF